MSASEDHAIGAATIADRIRAEFPTAGDQIYLNTAAEGLGSATLERSLLRYAAAKRRGSAGRAEMTDTAAATKERLARRLACRAEDLAFFGTTSDAIATVLRGLPWEATDNVVITDLEFPSAMIGCLSLAQQFGVRVRVISHSNGDIDSASFSEQIDERTRLVVLSHVSFHSGTRFDLPEIVDLAHQRGALTLIDVSQSLGVIPVALGDADFLVGCAFKWLVASHGLSFLAVNPSLENPLPRHTFGWQGVTDFLAVMRERAYTTYDGARRFESGMPNYPAVYALYDALDLLDRLHPPWIESHVQSLTTTIWTLCRGLGLAILTPDTVTRRAGIVSFAHPAATAIGDALAAEGVVTWYRDGRVRLSPHCYTSESDLRALVPILSSVTARFPAPSGAMQ